MGLGKLFKKLKGKKTYIAAAVTTGFAVADLVGYEVPPAAYAVAVALGLVNARRATTRLEDEVLPYKGL